jgi:hypothetical protein
VIVIVGHGPSIVGKALGPWLDEQRVVRLKRAEKPNAADWGTRTDVICATSHIYRQDGVPFWWFPKGEPPRGDDLCRVADIARWRAYFGRFSRLKGPSTGLSAIFCAVEFEGATEIGLAGFDNLLYPQETGYAKWWQPRYKYNWDADSEAEHKAACGLGVRLIDVTREHG